MGVLCWISFLQIKFMNKDRDKNREVKNITHTRKMNINGGSDIFITLSNPCRNGYKSHRSTSRASTFKQTFHKHLQGYGIPIPWETTVELCTFDINSFDKIYVHH